MEDLEFKALLYTCRLKLDEKTELKIKKDIEETIKYFNKLDELNCEDVNPAYHPIEPDSDLREDIPENFSDKKELLENTKTHRFYVIGPEI
jgi:aspartyl/glutamyl-tRNA(Asn/Gln) amidotransferase C subunit